MYILSSVGYNIVDEEHEKTYTLLSSICSLLLSTAVIILYFYLYECKISIYIPLYAILGGLIPLVARGVSRIRARTWRGRQAKDALRWFYMPLILGVAFYVAMARFDISSMCRWKMRPTIVSAPTAFLKGSEYREGFGSHMKSFAAWSALSYGVVLGVSLPVVLLKKF